MKIAISGKGGSGKTTIAATLARTFARQGYTVLAIDGDPNPNLSVALGMNRDQISALHPVPRDVATRQIGEDGKTRVTIAKPVNEIVDNHSVVGPDGVRLIMGSRVDHPGSG
jgi:CO dehydrogenase maturation factor